MNEDVEYKLALGYGGFAALAWLAVAIARMRNWRGHVVAAATLQEGQYKVDVERFGGALLVDGMFALAFAVIFGFVVYKLLQATWNSWDWATAVTGGAAVLSLIMLCARNRVMVYAPFTLFPFWLLLYRPGVKHACAVGTGPHHEVELPEPADDSGPAPAVDLKREREALTGIYQSLHVFELERGMDTDTFVARYAEGLEEDTADNEEWFALARMARRGRERLQGMNGQLPIVNEQ